MRKCNRCDYEGSLDSFPKKGRDKQGNIKYGYMCYECYREYQRNYFRIEENAVKQRARVKQNKGPNWQQHGLSEEQYVTMLTEQSSKCKICSKTTILVVDHDHNCCPGPKSCGTCVRGLLCVKCNSAIGLLNDKIEILNKAIEYLGTAARW